MHLNFKNQKGIGLVETVAALGVTVIVITALVSLAIFTLRSSTNAKTLLTATKLAEEEVELVRAVRDNFVWTDESNDSGFIEKISSCNTTNKCYVGVSSGVISVGSNSTGEALTVSSQPFTRYFIVEDPVNNNGVQATDTVVRVRVYVNWTLGGQQKTASVYTEFSNWR